MKQNHKAKIQGEEWKKLKEEKEKAAIQTNIKWEDVNRLAQNRKS